MQRYTDMLRYLIKEYRQNIIDTINLGKVHIFRTDDLQNHHHDLMCLDAFCDQFDMDIGWDADKVITVLFNDKYEDYVVQVWRLSEI